jgi:hypothetical protein
VVAAAGIALVAAIVSIPILRTSREAEAVAAEILENHRRALQ